MSLHLQLALMLVLRLVISEFVLGKQQQKVKGSSQKQLVLQLFLPTELTSVLQKRESQMMVSLRKVHQMMVLLMELQVSVMDMSQRSTVKKYQVVGTRTVTIVIRVAIIVESTMEDLCL